MKNKLLMKWEDIKPQFDKTQQDFFEKSIWMAKETGNPQQIEIKLGGTILVSFGIFPSGLIYKIL